PALASLRHTSPLLGYQTVSAIFFCAAPVALFLFAWTLTRAPLYSFFAALFYSLLSPAQMLVPEGAFSWVGGFTPHRFKLQAVWDETPHCAAITFLFLFLMFLVRDGRRSRALAAVSLALALLAWPFAIVPAVLSVLCLLTARRTGALTAIAIGIWAL